MAFATRMEMCPGEDPPGRKGLLMAEAMDFSVRYAQAVEDETNARYKTPAALEFWKGKQPDRFGVVAGRRYDKVVSLTATGQARSAYAFVDRETGLLYKAESWSKPAKGPRGSVATDADLAAVMSRFNLYGGYLYAN